MSSQLSAKHIEESGKEHAGLLVVRALFFLHQNGMGIVLTYLNIYLRSIGLTGTQVGWLNSISPTVRTVGEPVWGLLDDRFGRIRLLLVAAGIGAVVSAGAMAFSQSFLAVFVAISLFSFFHYPINTLLNGVTMKLLADKPQNFSRVRMWGTLGFLVTTLGFGYLLEATGYDLIFPGYAVTMAIFTAVSFLLPATSGVGSTQSFVAGLGRLVRQPAWSLFTLSQVVFGIALNGMFAFIGLYIEDLGGGPEMVGNAWAAGVLTELPVMFMGALLIRRFGVRQLLVIGYMVSCLRWLLYGLMPSAVWAIPISLLHGIGFGAYYIGGVAYVNDLAPPDLKATAQGLFNVAAFALPSIVGSPISGSLYDTIGPATLFRLYALMGLLSLGLLWAAFRLRQTVEGVQT